MAKAIDYCRAMTWYCRSQGLGRPAHGNYLTGAAGTWNLNHRPSAPAHLIRRAESPGRAHNLAMVLLSASIVLDPFGFIRPRTVLSTPGPVPWDKNKKVGKKRTKIKKKENVAEFGITERHGYHVSTQAGSQKWAYSWDLVSIVTYRAKATGAESVYLWTSVPSTV